MVEVATLRFAAVAAQVVVVVASLLVGMGRGVGRASSLPLYISCRPRAPRHVATAAVDIDLLLALVEAAAALVRPPNQTLAALSVLTSQPSLACRVGWAPTTVRRGQATPG